MKKLLLSVAVIAASCLALNAQTVTYDIGKIYSDVTSSTAVQSKDGLLIVNPDSKLKVEPNEKSSEGVVYTHRMKLGGKSSVDAATGMPKNCAFGIPVTGPGVIKFVVLTGSNSDLTRVIDYAHVATDGTSTTGSTDLKPGIVDTDKVTLNEKEYDHITPLTWNYTGGAGDLYFYSSVNGNNYYAIMYTPEEATGLDKTQAGVVSTTYYNLGGVLVSNPTSGVYICRQLLEDGSVKVTKAIVR